MPKFMPTEDFIIELFCKIDDEMKNVPKHSQSKLYPSEIVTIGLLFAIRGESERKFYRWLKGNFLSLFPKLPERTRLFRLLKTHQNWTKRFLAEPTVLGIADTYGIELIHPIREGRSKRQIGKKGVSNHRFIVGCKVCFVTNKFGLICGFDVATANVYDAKFRPLIESFKGEMIVFVDSHFHSRDGKDPENMKVCRRGKWNERMLIETVFSMMTRIFNFKKMAHRVWEYLRARISFAVAAFNILARSGMKVDENGFVHLSIAEFCP